MRRRELLKTLLAAPLSALIEPGQVTGPTPLPPRLRQALEHMPHGRAHVLAQAPYAWLDLTTPLSGKATFSREPKPRATGGIVVLPENAVDVPRLASELPALDRWARRHHTAVVIRWSMSMDVDQSAWLPRLRAETAVFVYVQEPVFSEPDDVIPTHYFLPVEVYREGKLELKDSVRVVV